jgi:hypothetical protein
MTVLILTKWIADIPLLGHILKVLVNCYISPHLVGGGCRIRYSGFVHARDRENHYFPGSTQVGHVSRDCGLEFVHCDKRICDLWVFFSRFTILDVES